MASIVWYSTVPQDTERGQGSPDSQVRLLDQADDLQLVGRGISHSPSPPSAIMLFFQQTQFKRLLGHDLLQRPRFTAQVRHLAARRCPRRVARQSALASFQELLRPAVIQALANTLAAAQLGNARLVPQTVQHDPDLLFG
jgi:hypothetical protein